MADLRRDAAELWRFVAVAPVTEFKVGDRVTYNGRRPPNGTIVEIITTSPTPYRVRWDTGKVSDWTAEGLIRAPERRKGERRQVVEGPLARMALNLVIFQDRRSRPP